jgi:hypothetical protein
MNLLARYRQWRMARREHRIDRLTTSAADLHENDEYDLLLLHQRGVVRVRGTGQSITQLYGEVENLIRRRLRVIIKPGTYFVARGNYQNMATRAEYRFSLSPLSAQKVAVKAACINAGLPIPDKNARFAGVKRVSDDLARFLEAARDADPMAVQAGVWALTNAYSGRDVQNRLVARDRLGNTHRAVSDAHIAEAKRILDSLRLKHHL